MAIHLRVSQHSCYGQHIILSLSTSNRHSLCKAVKIYLSTSWGQAFPSMIVELPLTTSHMTLNWSRQLLSHILENKHINIIVMLVLSSILLKTIVSPSSFLQTLYDMPFTLRRRKNLLLFIVLSNLSGGSKAQKHSWLMCRGTYYVSLPFRLTCTWVETDIMGWLAVERVHTYVPSYFLSNSWIESTPLSLIL